MLNFLNDLPLMLLTLPTILISLSVHEASHAYAAYKLGDPTAKYAGRLTINPIKHINLFGFICMLFFRIGWANPVPINPRNFKNSKKGMAISAAAGPLSNLCLAIIFMLLLRLVIIPIDSMIENAYSFYIKNGNLEVELLPSVAENAGFILLSLLALMFYLGALLNFNLMLFNLIPLPPLDGSRIAHIFLPTNLYFKIMQYERYIMIGFIVLLATGIISLPLNNITNNLSSLLFDILGISKESFFVASENIMKKLPKFTF